jgi:hypothetical protein
MNETPVTLQDITTLAALANGIIPADERDAGAASVGAGPAVAERMRRSPYGRMYVDGLKTAHQIAQTTFGKAVHELDAEQMHALLTVLSAKAPAFFRQFRSDVCSLYLSDPGVWQRIGFPGPATDLGGYPDFDQPQR